MNKLLNKTFLVCAIALLAQMSAWSAPEYMVTNVFTSGEGYHTYRIPAIVRANDGTLLAFCEGRASNSDLGDIDIVLKRSTDNGVTWGSLIVAQSEGTLSIGNPAPVVDRTTGDIHMLFCRENETVFHTVSTDNGLTWATRTEITANVKLPSWGWYATGPCHGVQLTRGDQAGRLVIPANHAIGSGASDTVEKGAQFLYSDDHGATWHMDAYFERAESAGGVAVAPNESTLVELNTPGDGGTGSHVYMNSRDYGTDPGNRSETWSGDGGGSFSVPYNGNPHFVTPVCQGSLIRFSATDEGDSMDRILFSSPNNASSRVNGSIWTTTNEAASWSAPKQLFAGEYAYSDMTITAAADLGVLAECNENGSAYAFIKFIRVNEEWLDDIETDAPTPNPATFAQVPVAINSATVTMTATTGTDATNPIEYLFTETTGNPGGTSSGWTTSAFYMDTGLSPDTEYTYTIAMRDPLGNTGTNSTPESVTTPAGAPGLQGLNLSWEFDGVTSDPFTGWTLTSLGGDPLDSGDFRVAADPDNWFEDSTAGTHVMLLEGDNGNEYGRLSQQLTGAPAAGTYTWDLRDLGVANFGDNSNAEFKFGFSLDGTNLLAGSRMTVTEGTDIFSPDNGLVANFQVTYHANDTSPLYLIIETTGAHIGRSVPTIGSTLLGFVADPPAPPPGRILDIDFSELTPGTTINTGSVVINHATNAYHGTWADGDGTAYDVVGTTNGAIGVDTTTHTSGNLVVQGFTFDGTASFTLEAIVNWNSTSSGLNGLFGQTASLNPNGNQLWIRENEGEIQYVFGIENGVGAQSWNSATAATLDVSAAKADGAFHHFAAVYDGAGGEIRFYLDGTLIGTDADSDVGGMNTQLINSAADFNLGAYNATSTRDFNGVLDHFRISDYALAPSEFIINEPVGPPTPATLTINIGADVVIVGSTNLPAAAGITNTLQFKLDLTENVWSNLYSVTGITETNWTFSTTNQSFFRIETSY